MDETARADAAPPPRTGAARGGAVPEALARLDSGGDVAELVPAATVVVLRDTPAGIEALMLRRSSKLAFAGGMWVFPGGRIDPDDHADPAQPSTEPDDLLAAARRAAAREAAEEAGIVVDPDRLVWFSHWTPPARSGKRYETWFFATSCEDADGELDVVVDGGEITDHRWMRPADALAQRDDGEIELSPPTWITLWHLRSHTTVAAALDVAAATEPERYATRIVVDGDEVLALYAGDVGYDDGDASRDGPRHRLRMRAGPWVYERD